MDLQKEREAFEAWYCRNHTGLKQSDLAKFRTLSGYSFSDSLKINVSWEAWQAAKAQAVPEGFVVVPVQCPDPDFADSLFDELSKKAIGKFGDDLLIHFSDIDEEKIWALMVEAAKAQAQAVPDGFVLVPMVPSERMINAVRQCYEGEAYLPYSLYSEFVNQAIIERMEAQEPAND
ncbi:hypothetical protein [uncultured Acinetobacter sp.]|uniref:hypothetical protein n=1 Tax=uncultured Acinetobacter sp. TaxID=165433 RepID=UPI002617FA29|nr:hypothetical protein [uncultured Acinetobacter sp.]